MPTLLTAQDIMDALGCSRASAYRILDKLREYTEAVIDPGSNRTRIAVRRDTLLRAGILVKDVGNPLFRDPAFQRAMRSRQTTGKAEV